MSATRLGVSSILPVAADASTVLSADEVIVEVNCAPPETLTVVAVLPVLVTVTAFFALPSDTTLIV